MKRSAGFALPFVLLAVIGAIVVGTGIYVWHAKNSSNLAFNNASKSSASKVQITKQAQVSNQTTATTSTSTSSTSTSSKTSISSSTTATSSSTPPASGNIYISNVYTPKSSQIRVSWWANPSAASDEGYFVCWRQGNNTPNCTNDAASNNGFASYSDPYSTTSGTYTIQSLEVNKTYSILVCQKIGSSCGVKSAVSTFDLPQ